jgi:hypothetical protein
MFKNLVIEITANGTLRVLVDGLYIGFIDELKLTSSNDKKPSIEISMVSQNKLPNESLHVLHKNREILQSCEFIKLFDQADTLPQGMQTVND